MKMFGCGRTGLPRGLARLEKTGKSGGLLGCEEG